MLLTERALCAAPAHLIIVIVIGTKVHSGMCELSELSELRAVF